MQIRQTANGAAMHGCNCSRIGPSKNGRVNVANALFSAAVFLPSPFSHSEQEVPLLYYYYTTTERPDCQPASQPASQQPITMEPLLCRDRAGERGRGSSCSSCSGAVKSRAKPSFPDSGQPWLAGSPTDRPTYGRKLARASEGANADSGVKRMDSLYGLRTCSLDGS